MKSAARWVSYRRRESHNGVRENGGINWGRCMRRHRTAIVLVGGWLLMVPRIDTKTGTVHKDSPVGTWNVERAYDTAHECEDGRRGYYAGANSKRVAAVFLSGRCVPAEHIYLRPWRHGISDRLLERPLRPRQTHLPAKEAR